jgi:CTP synthase
VNLVHAGLDRIVTEHLGLPTDTVTNLVDWIEMLRRIQRIDVEVEVAVVGKYIELHDAYKSIYEAFSHAGVANDCRVRVRKIRAEDVLEEGPGLLEGVHGVLVPGGFGERGLEGKIRAIRWARESGVPYFGICLGMQCAVIEYARHMCGLEGANSTEFNPTTAHNVIDLLPEQRHVQDKGGTMRLGLYPVLLSEGTAASRAYGQGLIEERHRHRYEVNNDYLARLEKNGLRISGLWAEKQLVEIIELPDHPWFVAGQFHPEFRSRPWEPHPLFAAFIKAALDHQGGA